MMVVLMPMVVHVHVDAVTIVRSVAKNVQTHALGGVKTSFDNDTKDSITYSVRNLFRSAVTMDLST